MAKGGIPSEQEMDAVAHHTMKLPGPPLTGEEVPERSLLPFVLVVATLFLLLFVFVVIL